MLGFSVDWDRFVKHLQAATGPDKVSHQSPYTPLSTQSEQGRYFLAYIDRFCRELNQPGSFIDDDRVGSETADTMQCLLAAILCGAADDRSQPSEAIMVKRAREILAENLESPVSLSDTAIMVGTSTRSLLRAFRSKLGTSPMAFRRRRRFEAARHDLFFAEYDETTVTVVANRYCFDHLGRFAGEYRALFGESPSDTLRS